MLFVAWTDEDDPPGTVNGLRLRVATTAAGEPSANPVALGLTASPSPFRSSTRLAFDLAEPGPVALDVFSANGRHLRRLLRGGTQPAGRHEVTWGGETELGAVVGPGVYFYTLRTARSTRAVASSSCAEHAPLVEPHRRWRPRYHPVASGWRETPASVSLEVRRFAVASPASKSTNPVNLHREDPSSQLTAPLPRTVV